MFFFFNDTATTEIYTLSLHDALPIYVEVGAPVEPARGGGLDVRRAELELDAGVPDVADVVPHRRDRKSTRLNSSHANISYAVFCLKKKTLTLIIPDDSLHM